MNIQGQARRLLGQNKDRRVVLRYRNFHAYGDITILYTSAIITLILFSAIKLCTPLMPSLADKRETVQRRVLLLLSD